MPNSTITRDEELFLREALWAELRAHPQWLDLPAEVLRGLKIYSGQAGIYSDMSRTRSLAPTGVAVSVLHTGRHYADDLDDDGIVYHYPTTGRIGHDQSEIDSVKTAQRLGLPIFVIVQKGKFRQVKRAWISDSDDASRLFLPKIARPKTLTQVMRRERSSRFKFESLKRYGGKCVLSGLSVVEMLDGAHVIPVDKGGSDDPRNGLLLSASLHRALDANLWAINPKTLELETRKHGPSLTRMKIAVSSLGDTPVLPRPEALEFRYDLFLRAG